MGIIFPFFDLSLKLAPNVVLTFETPNPKTFSKEPSDTSFQTPKRLISDINFCFFVGLEPYLQEKNRYFIKLTL